MKQYLLSICYPAGATQPNPDALAKIMKDVQVVRTEMRTAGVWVFSGGLSAPGSATVLKMQNGEPVTVDGPFIESKEQIGGITILQVEDLDAAISWAKKLTRAVTVPVEVRPFVENHG